MRMVFTKNVSANTRALARGSVVLQAHLVHRE